MFASSRFQGSEELIESLRRLPGVRSLRSIIFHKRVTLGENDYLAIGNLSISKKKETYRCNLQISISLANNSRMKMKLDLDEVLNLIASRMESEPTWRVGLLYHYDDSDYETLIPLPIQLDAPAVGDLREVRGLRVVRKGGEEEFHLIVDRWDNKDFHHAANYSMRASINDELFVKLVAEGDTVSKAAVRKKVRE